MSGTDQADVQVHRCGPAGPIHRPQGPRLPFRTIDMHCHVFVPEVQAMIAGTPAEAAEAQATLATFGARSLEINAAQLREIGPRLTTLEARLADMDAMGVDMQVISISPTQYFYSVDDRDLAAALVTRVNERIAATCAANPARLAGLGSVALQFPDLAARQLRHAIRAQGLRGVEISTHVCGIDLADRRFDPFWAEADALGAIVFLHPWGTTTGNRLSRHYLGNTVGNPVETAIALSNLIFEGTLDRHPGARIVAAHGGGYLPPYIARSDHAHAVRPEACGCQHPPSHYLRRIWFDSLVYDPGQLRRLIEVVGAGQVVLGTDYPFDMGHYDPAALLAGLDAQTQAAIAGGNAASLLGLAPAARLTGDPA